MKISIHTQFSWFFLKWICFMKMCTQLYNTKCHVDYIIFKPLSISIISIHTGSRSTITMLKSNSDYCSSSLLFILVVQCTTGTYFRQFSTILSQLINQTRRHSINWISVSIFEKRPTYLYIIIIYEQYYQSIILYYGILHRTFRLEIAFLRTFR